MSTDLRLSVALVTRNRLESLRRCLTSLREQDPQPWEIVVSDDGDPPDAEATGVIADDFGARYLTGPRRGLYANRNAAALACTGTHIRSMDDDHTFPAGHVAQCLDAIALDPHALWTCGERSFIDGKPYGFTAHATQLHPSGVASAITNVDDNWAIADGATIYPRDVFDRGFRFVEELGFGSAYLEFGALLYARGWRSRCIPGAFIEHHADRGTLDRRAPLSTLFAGLCYNLHFRPSLARALRYVAPHARHFAALPRLATLARTRWQS